EHRSGSGSAKPRGDTGVTRGDHKPFLRLFLLRAGNAFGPSAAVARTLAVSRARRKIDFPALPRPLRTSSRAPWSKGAAGPRQAAVNFDRNNYTGRWILVSCAGRL